MKKKTFLNKIKYGIAVIDNKMFKLMPDSNYIKIIYEYRIGKKLNLKNPQTFNEKLQWLKLNDRKEIYTMMVDKYEVKEYVSNIIGKEYIIPTLGIYNNFDEINYEKLPDKFVIKCTHDSGGLVIVKDKKNFDKKAARKKINKNLKFNYYYGGREWPYKNVKPRILIEKYMEDKATHELRDYKFFCFNGKAKFMFIATGRQQGNTKFNFYDMNFNLLPFRQGHPNDLSKIEKPAKFNEMIKIAEALSKGIPQVRVDLYLINEKIYFGEMTFYHYSGFTKFEPEVWDKNLGKYININIQKNGEINEKK